MKDAVLVYEKRRRAASLVETLFPLSLNFCACDGGDLPSDGGGGAWLRPVSRKPLQLRFNMTLYESMRAMFVSRSRELVQR